jgi:hypothetical protein
MSIAIAIYSSTNILSESAPVRAAATYTYFSAPDSTVTGIKIVDASCNM